MYTILDMKPQYMYILFWHRQVPQSVYVYNHQVKYAEYPLDICHYLESYYFYSGYEINRYPTRTTQYASLHPCQITDYEMVVHKTHREANDHRVDAWLKKSR